LPHYKTLTFTHISFVADCFLFCRAIEVESSTLTKILDTYGRASRQLVNFHKSKVFFSPHATNDIKQHIMSFLGISNIIGTRKYLRMSSPIGRKKKYVFVFLKDKLWNRINHWSNKHLSKEWKEVLFKSSAQAIPTYYMSIYLLPLILEDEIQKLMNSFWWGSRARLSKGVHWLNWEKLTMKNEFEGLGFTHLHGFNHMLGKQCWKLSANSNAIVTKVLKAKYYRNNNLGMPL